MQLEVKDISELYEIWCFIKVKNIVQHILREKATMHAEGSKTEGEFIKSLIQGSKSEVTFFETENPDVQLASVMCGKHEETQNLRIVFLQNVTHGKEIAEGLGHLFIVDI